MAINKRTQNILGFVVAILIGVGWAIWQMQTKPAKPHIHESVRKVVAKYPSLKPIYDAAMTDNVLTTSEAKAIIDNGAELRGP